MERAPIRVAARLPREGQRQAPVHERDLAPVRLGRLTRTEPGAHVRELRFVALERGREQRAHVPAPRVLGEALLEILEFARVALEDELAAEFERECGRLRRHVRISVAVAADPAPEMQEGRDAHEGAVVLAEPILEALE